MHAQPKSFSSLGSKMKKMLTLSLVAFVAQVVATPESHHEHGNEPHRPALLRPIFDAKTQRVDVSGRYAFKPPGPGDERGPCPGLNALANHNYLPHNGVATIQEIIEATSSVYGLGVDAALILATYATVLVGDLTSFSVGGPSEAVGIGIGNLLSRPLGLSLSHNKLESDASPTRADLYQTGDAATMQLALFKDLYAHVRQARSPGKTLDALNAYHAKRLAQSKSQNPYFFMGAFSGILVSNGAYFFVYRLFGNKSAEYPEGILTPRVLKSFYGVSVKNNNLIYTPGHERIPDNWYRRAIGDEYTTVTVVTDLLRAILKYPQLVTIGGNTGSVNSFAGVDLGNLTGGVYNLQNLRQGNNAGCFALQAAQMEAPDLLNDLSKDPVAGLTLIQTSFAKVLSKLSCPQLSFYNPSEYSKCPGYTRSRKPHVIN